MDPEERICLLLAKGRLSPVDRDEALAIASQGPRWELILDLSIQQEVYPLICRNLRDLGFPGVPVEAQEKFTALFRMNVLRNDLLARELVQLLTTLHQASIPVIPLKGLYLAESLYGETSLRVCSDMDILVPRNSVPQAFDLLLSRGYQADFPRWVATDRMMQRCVQIPLWQAEGAMQHLVEIHWGLFLEASHEEAGIQDLWAEARRKDFQGAPAWILSPEWQFLFLLVHAARHNWQGLKWLADIHEICVQGGIQWAKVLAKSRMMGWDPMVQWSLGVCHAILGTPLPSSIPLQLPHPRRKLLLALRSRGNRWKNLLVLLRAERRLSRKFGLLARRLFVPTTAEYALCRLPGSLAFLYYPLRPLRIGCTMGRSLVRLVFSVR